MCPLAAELVEKGLPSTLVERGGEENNSSEE
jgi:hypothetical protein